jgi:hypothetical protein
MSKLIERINTLSGEVENFPLGKCSPSNDPDMQTLYLYSFNSSFDKKCSKTDFGA